MTKRKTATIHVLPKPWESMSIPERLREMADNWEDESDAKLFPIQHVLLIVSVADPAAHAGYTTVTAITDSSHHEVTGTLAMAQHNNIQIATTEVEVE